MEEVWRIRKQIEEIDKQMVKLLDRRMRLVERLGKIKIQKGMPLRDPGREEDLVKKLLQIKHTHLKPEELKTFYKVIFAQSVLRQKRRFEGMFGPFPVCVSVVPHSSREAEKLIFNLLERAEMVELRIDALKDGLPELPERIPLVLTNRKQEEGGRFSGPEKERIEKLVKAIEVLNPWYVDIEASTPEPYIKEVVSKGVKVILSHHDLSGTPSPHKLLERLKGMQREGVDIYKIVTTAKIPGDSAKVLAFLSEAEKLGLKVVGHAMGKEGRISRIMSPYFGAPFVYASPEDGMEAAPGQMTPEELREAWLLLERWFYT